MFSLLTMKMLNLSIAYALENLTGSCNFVTEV